MGLTNMKNEILKSIWDKCFKKSGDKVQELGILKITFLETNSFLYQLGKNLQLQFKIGILFTFFFFHVWLCS